MSEAGFLRAPEPTAEAQRLFDEDVAEVGYVMNVYPGIGPPGPFELAPGLRILR